MLFTLKKVIGGMLLPLPLMLLMIGVGLALLWFSRFQKTGKVFISVGWLALLLLSLQPVSDHLLRPIENRYPTWQGPQKVEYIVVLGGGYTWNPQWAPSSNLINNKLAAAGGRHPAVARESGSQADFYRRRSKNQYGKHGGGRCAGGAVAGRTA